MCGVGWEVTLFLVVWVGLVDKVDGGFLVVVVFVVVLVVLVFHVGFGVSRKGELYRGGEGSWSGSL